ncbi:hypothetical protein R1flu_001082 [Riccia fluitans]|uniref:Uncharacterized protein n=1 Tax=Riccia fluitans TaxID=41844 RepID=A0ABD1Y2B0_9MARC
MCLWQNTVKEKATTKEKDKGPAYKLQSDIEVAIDLNEVLEERIFNAKIEFSLREILGVAKKEFHDVIIDIIKRKMQLVGESALVNMLDTIVSREEEKELAVVYQHSAQKGKNLRVRLDDDEEEEVGLKST